MKEKKIKIGALISPEANNMLMEVASKEFPYHGSRQISAIVEMMIRSIYTLSTMTPDQKEFLKNLGKRQDPQGAQ